MIICFCFYIKKPAASHGQGYGCCKKRHFFLKDYVVQIKTLPSDLWSHRECVALMKGFIKPSFLYALDDYSVTRMLSPTIQATPSATIEFVVPSSKPIVSCKTTAKTPPTAAQKRLDFTRV